MNDWSKISSYARLHQAELRKDILENNNIPTVIIKEKDSVFLFGEFDIYVENKNTEKAVRILNQFEGWTKINSFIRQEPVLLVKEVIDNLGFETQYLVGRDPLSDSINYQLFIKNEDSDKIKPIIEYFEGWVKIDSFHKTIQMAALVDILVANKIQSIVVKNLTSDLYVQDIDIYVEEKNVEESKALFDKLENWVEVGAFSNYVRAELFINVLEKNSITVLEKEDEEGTHLYVKQEFENTARKLIRENLTWTKIGSYTGIYEAEIRKGILATNNIEAVIITNRDSSFLIGEVALYVVDDDNEKAKMILDAVSDIDTQNVKEADLE